MEHLGQVAGEAEVSKRVGQILILPQSHSQMLLYLKMDEFWSQKHERVVDLFGSRKGHVNPIQLSFKTSGFATKQNFSSSDQICHLSLW